MACGDGADAFQEERVNLSKADSCFVCGQDNAGGLQAPFRFNTRYLFSFCQLTLDERFQGWQGVVHGGILAALLDEACIYAALGVGPRPVTADLKVRYRRPVPCHAAVTLFGEVVQRRRQIVHARARLVYNGRVRAEAEGRVFLT
jgi:uncharacterized protein (TIGR00369 family)